MKKVIMLMLATIIMITLCSCGGNPFEDIENSLVDSTVDTTAVAPTKENDNAKDEDEKNGEDSSGKVSDFAMGTTNGTVYENKFIGIGCDFGEGWSFFEKENIAELNASAGDGAAVYDMIALGFENSDNANVMLQEKTKEEMKELDVNEHLKKVAEEVKASVESSGAKDWKIEYKKVEIDGESFESVEYSFALNEMSICQKTLAKKCDGYLVTITINSSSSEKVNSILDKFYLVH